MKKAIYLSATDKWISIGNYVRAWKACLANPEIEFKHGLCTWWPQKGRDILRDFTDGVHDRINQAVKNKHLKTI